MCVCVCLGVSTRNRPVMDSRLGSCRSFRMQSWTQSDPVLAHSSAVEVQAGESYLQCEPGAETLHREGIRRLGV